LAGDQAMAPPCMFSNSMLRTPFLQTSTYKYGNRVSRYLSPLSKEYLYLSHLWNNEYRIYRILGTIICKSTGNYCIRVGWLLVLTSAVRDDVDVCVGTGSARSVHSPRPTAHDPRPTTLDPRGVAGEKSGNRRIHPYGNCMYK
jgi:hypothetical protein